MRARNVLCACGLAGLWLASAAQAQEPADPREQAYLDAAYAVVPPQQEVNPYEQRRKHGAGISAPASAAPVSTVPRVIAEALSEPAILTVPSPPPPLPVVQTAESLPPPSPPVVYQAPAPPVSLTLPPHLTPSAAAGAPPAEPARPLGPPKITVMSTPAPVIRRETLHLAAQEEETLPSPLLLAQQMQSLEPSAGPDAAAAPAPAPTPLLSAPAPVGNLPDAVPPDAVKPYEAPVSAAPAAPEQLSEESKRIAEKIPSNLDKKEIPTTPGTVSIARGKPPRDLEVPEGKKDAPAHAAAQEAMGIKIEVKKPPINLDYELEKAYKAVISGETDAAIRIYKTVLDNDGDNADALFGLATSYHRIGRLDLARPYYAHLLTVDPQHRDGLNNFLVLLADEAPQEALAQLEQLEARNPEFSPIPAQMALILQKQGAGDQALGKMQRAMQLAPENLTYRYNYAILLDKQGRYEEAAGLYGEIMEAYQRGAPIPGNAQRIQQRLTFISSNRL